MPNPFAFFVRTKDLKAKITKRKKIKETDFTILSNSINTHDEHGLMVLKACMDAYPKEFVRSLVCLQPERLIDNEILAQLQAGVKLDVATDDEEGTFRRAFELVKESLRSGDSIALQTFCTELYASLSTQLPDFFTALARGENLDDSPFSESERHTMRQLYDEIATQSPYAENRELLQTVCLQRWIALIYTKRSQEHIGTVVRDHIERHCSAGALERLPYVPREEGIAIFTTGGVASGKGTCLRNIEESLRRRTPKSITWNELVHHNADRIKPFLLNPERDSKRYSQYTYEEALAVKERVMTIIAQRGQETARYPHFMHDQTKLKPDELKEASLRYGELIIAAVSTDAATAIERAYHRGERTNRFEHTEGLLGSHQAVPGEFIKSLNQDELIGSNTSVAMYDNNSADLRMFASINMRNRVITIYNEKDLQNWIKKETINPKADSIETLYMGADIRRTTDYFAPLLEKGFTLDLTHCLPENLVEESPGPGTTMGLSS
ncbi:zeta toxin family protein [Legionella nagasakiensis]|uniref:zeta toxin family protein n=1 Tax=Legionella nagasakiensis TaxID=535290 RepID=UPI00105614B2|nr:zeta toxin family protein [Legionella nagasakiensis]